MDDKTTFLISLGIRIRQLRKEKGLRQIDLADKCGMEDRAIGRIENGRINSSIFVLKRISDALETDLSELLKLNQSDKK